MAAPTVNTNRAFIAGAEHNDFGRNAPTDGNITTSTVQKRTGTYAYRVQAASGVKSTWTMSANDASSENCYFFRGYLYIATLPASTRALLCKASSLSTSAPGLRLRSTGILEFHDGTSLIAAGSTALATGTWYRIEVGLNTTDDVVSLKINGNVEIDWTATGGNATAMNSLILGAIDTVAATFDVYWDDIAIDAVDWCGPGRVKRLALSGAGTSTAAGFSIGGSSPAATKYQSLNELSTDEGVTFVTTSTTGETETYQIDDLPADCVQVRGVQVRARHRRSGGSNGNFNAVAKLYGHLLNFGTTTTTSAFQWYEGTAPGFTDTPVGGHYTNARVNAIELGIRTNSANGSDVSALAAEVDYDDTVGASVTIQRLYATGFEAGDVTADGSVTGTAAAATNVARNGTYSLRVNPAGNTASFVTPPNMTASGQRELFVCGWIYVTARPTGASTMRLFSVRSSSTFHGAVRMDSAGKIQLEDRSGVIGSLSSAAIPLNTWTRIDFSFRCSTTTSSNDGAMEVFVNGASYASSTASNSNNAAWTDFNIGTVLAPGAGGCDVNYDDWTFDSTAPINPADNIAVLDLLPTAAGALTGTGFSANGQANQYDCLDETPSNGDTDYVGTGTTNPATGSYVTQDVAAAAGAIRSVSAVSSFKRDGASNGVAEPGLRTNGHSSRFSANATTSAYAWVRQMIANSDYDGAWTAALVNGSELSIRNASANASRCSNLRMSVEYVFAGAAGPGGMVPQVQLVG